MINADLTFEIDIQPQGLNDRSTSKTVVIPRDQIVNSELSAQELAVKIAAEHGKESDSFVKKLEAKIIWVRYIKDDKSLHEAVLSTINLLNVACKSMGLIMHLDMCKSETRHPEFISFLRDRYMQETIEILSQSGNKVRLSL